MFTTFQDLKIWQNARLLAVEIYQTTKAFPKEEVFGLTSQLRRSSISVASNIAESTGRWGEKDKIQLLMVARGSLIETQSHLLISQSLNYLDSATCTKLIGEYEMVAKSLNAFIKALRPANQQTNRRLTN